MAEDEERDRGRDEDADYAYRQSFACKVCGNWPDPDGILEHGDGCYVLDSDGGGEEWVDLAPPAADRGPG